MPPSLATYQQAASAIYEPQKAADITTAQATTAADVANLEASKGQVQTDYQTAINNLTSTTNSNVAKINQLYTLRLGGNFSGLQGNDLGGMFAKATQAQGVIESTRANKLTQIATTETNDKNQLNATIASLTSKYQGQEASYAQSSYAAATKEYDTQQQRDFTNQLALAKYNLSASKAAVGKAPTQAETKQADMATIGSFLNSVVGKDGHVSQQNWNKAMQQWLNAGYSAKDFTSSNTQFINQRYSGYHGFS